MCTLHSVLPNDCTLRYYAEKVATFCSICWCKWEACLTPASWLWDIISLNSLTTCLACGAAGFKWRSRAAKQSFLCLGWQYTWKPVVSVTLCSWEGHALQEVMARSLSKQSCQTTSKGASQIFSWKESLWLLSWFKIQRAGPKWRPCSFK